MRAARTVALAIVSLSSLSPGLCAQRGVRAEQSTTGSLSVKIEGARVEFGNYRALLIGIDRYDDAKINALATAENDVRRIAEILRTQYGFRDTKFLLNESATKRRIESVLTEYADLGDDDNLLIYYAGHGQLRRHLNDTPEGYLIPHDAKLGDWESYVSVAAVQALIKDKIKRARHVFVIADSCFSGIFARTRHVPDVPKDIRVAHRDRSCNVLTSGALELVGDAGKVDKKHSPFAYQLIRLLNGNTAPYLFEYVLAHNVASAVINHGAQQEPEYAPMPGDHRENGQFVFLRTVPKNAAGITLELPKDGIPPGFDRPAMIERRHEDGSWRWFSTGNDETEMILIPGGWVPRGADLERVPPFFIDRDEVTNRRWKRFVAADKEVLLRGPDHNRPNYSSDQQPVVRVRLRHARRFAVWARKRLPNASQWEFAALWDRNRNALAPFALPGGWNNAGFKACEYPPEVGSTAKDVSDWGVRGMRGGIRELCELGAEPGREGGVIRGGTEYMYGMPKLSVLLRDRKKPCGPDDHHPDTGFRCIVPLPRL